MTPLSQERLFLVRALDVWSGERSVERWEGRRRCQPLLGTLGIGVGGVGRVGGVDVDDNVAIDPRVDVVD